MGLDFVVACVFAYWLVKRGPRVVAEAVAEALAAQRGGESPAAAARRERLLDAGVTPASAGGPMRQFTSNAWRDFWLDAEAQREARRATRPAPPAGSGAGGRPSWRARLADRLDAATTERAARWRTRPPAERISPVIPGGSRPGTPAGTGPRRRPDDSRRVRRPWPASDDDGPTLRVAPDDGEDFDVIHDDEPPVRRRPRPPRDTPPAPQWADMTPNERLAEVYLRGRAHHEDRWCGAPDCYCTCPVCHRARREAYGRGDWCAGCRPSGAGPAPNPPPMPPPSASTPGGGPRRWVWADAAHDAGPADPVDETAEETVAEDTARSSTPPGSGRQAFDTLAARACHAWNHGDWAATVRALDDLRDQHPAVYAGAVVAGFHNPDGTPFQGAFADWHAAARLRAGAGDRMPDDVAAAHADGRRCGRPGCTCALAPHRPPSDEPIKATITVGHPDTQSAPSHTPIAAIEGVPMSTVARQVTGVVSGAAEARAIRRDVTAATEAYVAALARIRARVNSLGEQTVSTVQMALHSRVVANTAAAAEAAAAAQAAANQCAAEVGPLLDAVGREFDRVNS